MPTSDVSVTVVRAGNGWIFYWNNQVYVRESASGFLFIHDLNGDQWKVSIEPVLASHE